MGRGVGVDGSTDEDSIECGVVHGADDGVEGLLHLPDRLGEDVVLLEGGGALAAVGLLEDALVAPGETAPARWAVLCADALHLEAPADGACACAPLRPGLGLCRVVLHHGGGQVVCSNSASSHHDPHPRPPAIREHHDVRLPPCSCRC